MTTLLMMKRWLGAASAKQRVATTVGCVVVLALVAVALVPAPAQPSREVLARGSAPMTPQRGDGELRRPGVAPNVSAPDTAAGTASPGAGRRVTPTTPSPVELTATDKGVTADAIKLGFSWIAPGLAKTLNYFPSYRTDASRAIDALVDYANDRGGVLGRRIVATKVNPDFTNQDDQRAKCIELTETHGVFAVIDSISLGAPPTSSCVAEEHDTLLVNGIPWSSSDIEHNAPYHVSLFKDDNRKMKDLAEAAKSTGFFDPAKGFKQLGIVFMECRKQQIIDGSNGLLAHLRAAGVSSWTQFGMTCLPGSFQASAANAVLALSNANVSHVLLALNPPTIKEFLDAAGEARYYPDKYFTSDFHLAIAGGLTDRYEPRGFDGALGVTSTHAGEGATGKAPPPLMQKCSQIFTEHGLAAVSQAPPLGISDDVEVLQLCENFLLFLDAATRVGPNLTRASWLGALRQLGAFRGALVDTARFGPGKPTGGDTMKLVVWRASCTCWREFSDFGPAAG